MPPERLLSHFLWLTMQRKCKSNAEYQACLNILLRCRFSSAKKMQTSAMKACFQIAECRFSSAKIQQKATFCNSLFGLRAKSAHIFNIYTENQAVTKPLNISHLKRESVSFLSKSFLSFSKSKTLFPLYKEYIYKYIFIYIFFIELFFIFKIENDKNDFDKNDKIRTSGKI